jgi:hypothetical protein
MSYPRYLTSAPLLNLSMVSLQYPGIRFDRRENTEKHQAV